MSVQFSCSRSLAEVQEVSDRLQDTVLAARQRVAQLQDSTDVVDLRRSVSELTEGYTALCQEIYHLSRHVIFHEHGMLSKNGKEDGKLKLL